MITVWEGKVAGTPQAVLTCMLGTLCSAGMLSTAGKLLSEQVDVLRLAFYTAPISAICLAPLFYKHEVGQPLQYICMSDPLIQLHADTKCGI